MDDDPTEDLPVPDRDDTSSAGRARKESLAIPRTIRDAVDARDGHYCRVCGKYLGDQRALHHIEYGGDARGLGGRRVHDIDGIVTVCWMWAGNCHDRVHSDKRRYQPLLREIVHRPGLTVLQLIRWRRPGPLTRRPRRDD